MLHEETRLKLGFDSLDGLFVNQFLNILGDRQDAHGIINISIVVLHKDVALHLSGIDQEGSRFTLPKKEHSIYLYLHP